MRSKGFTLIELLVVIAIIAILAAMLFPVFARARESARKIQCMSNIKNIALAVNMYFGDYDGKFWPDGSSDTAALAMLRDGPCGKTGSSAVQAVNRINPYLKPQVILDEYTKNRDVWHCPSAKLERFGFIVLPMGKDGYWLNNYLEDWPCGRCAGVSCSEWAFPTGWGGVITDSRTQGETFSSHTSWAEGSFTWSISVTDFARLNNHIDDAAKFVVASDVGAQPYISAPSHTAFPDTCKINYIASMPTHPCASVGCDPETIMATRPECPIQTCHPYGAEYQAFWVDKGIRDKYTRHLGGSNLGFADGHAKWMDAIQLLTAVAEGKLDGFCGPDCVVTNPNAVACAEQFR